MKPIVVEIPGDPVAQGRPRATVIAGHAHVYDPEKSREWKLDARDHMTAACSTLLNDDLLPLTGPVKVEIYAVWALPKSRWKKRQTVLRAYRSRKPDAENVAKSVLDAASGILFVDDAQVADLLVVKLDSKQGDPGMVRVIVEPLTYPL